MAESNATQVILTDDGIKIINAQNTADNAAGGVANLNDPNLMSVIEKQNNVVQFAGLTSQYNVIIQNAKDNGIDTTTVVTAYNNLNQFMANVLTDPDHASDVDRVTYKKYQDTYNEGLAKLQSALQNNANNKFTSAASATSQAASTANAAKSAADSNYAYANSEIAVQSTATAKAQSAADNAFSQAQAVGSQASAGISSNSMATAKAQSAADNAFSQAQAVGSQASAEIATQSEATATAQNTADSAFKQAQSATDYTDKQIASQASAVSEVSKNASEASSQANSALDAANSANAEITNLKGGSTLTIAKLEDGLGTKVDNGDFSAYKTQTASQFAETVKEADFKTYQTQTSKLIESKVDNGIYQSDKTQTANDIASKVSSGEFNTYKTQTADLIDDKVSSSEYASDKTQTASQISQMVSNSAFSAYQTQTASQIAQTVSNSAFSAYQQTTADLIASKVATKDFSAYQATTAKSIESKVESSDFNTYKTQTDKMISSKVSTVDFNNLAISNRNLALGTATAFKMTGNGAGNNAVRMYSLSSTITKGTTITIAFDITSTNATGFYNAQLLGGSWQGSGTSIPLASGTQHQSYTITTSADYSDGIQMRLDNSTSMVTVSNLIISKSSKEVGWTPAPEDQATQSQITQLSGEIEQKVDNGDFSTYKTQTDKLIGSKVDNSDFSTYQKQTADLISAKVSTKDFSAYQDTTAKAISSKVESSDFNTYKTQTADLIDDKVSSSEYASDKTQTASQIAQMVSNSAFSAYQTQTASQIASKVDNSDFSTYKQQTADLISSKVATKDFNTYVSQTATVIDSKVASSAFDSYKQQTAEAISSKVDNGDFSTYKNQTATDISLKVSAKDLIDQINIQAGNTLISSSGQLTLSGKNIYFDTANPVIIPNANIDTVLVNKNLQAADISANTFTTNNGTFTVDKYGAVVASNLTIRGVTNLVYNAALLGGSGSSIPGWTISNNGCYWPGNVHDGVPSIGWNSTATGWTLFAQTKLVPLNGVTGQPFSASAWFKDFGSDTSLKYQLTLAFFDSSGNRIYGGPVDNSWNGSSSNQGWTYKTINNAVAPNNAASVGLQYWAYNGKGNAEFSSPMLTQTAQATGYQPDTGNVVSAGEIDGSVINGSTINGTTINAGTKLNQYGNTDYPLTINPDGSVTSTSFGNIADDPAALRTVMKDGMVKTNFRGMNPISTGIYAAADVALGAGQLALLEGYSTSQDPNFTTTGMKKTGYAILDASTGLSLHGVTQAINFSGTDQDQTTGIIMNSYGNIIGYPNSAWWRIVSNSGSTVADFGIDSGGSNNIKFYRELDIGNFQINTGHTITSADNGNIHFAKGRGGAADIYAGDVHYTSLVKSSLLSVKKDVRKADTAYWAQLVNSIDLATYQYKTDDNTSHLRLSSIVDDVNVKKQWQLPDVFISRDENGKLNGVDDSVLLNATLATVQEQQKEIDQLNGHLLELEAKLNG